ncbi:MAG: DUF6293 family protein [Haloquadratum sp.]|jgi:hypothetical protein|nr:DUF6293 family protein [Haloferacaceae archaeon]MDR9445335.1 DUF6293 family protein [Haloquadratum sp.]
METHIIPVGFDYDRLIAPLVRDRHAVDRVVLLEGSVGSAENVAYSQRLTARLRTDFETLLGAETQRLTLEDVYDHDAAFSTAFTLITAELERSDAEVWVNISSMPRPVSFAFATAAHSIMVESAADRDRIHVYYTAPERYLETELAEHLRRVTDRLERTTTDAESEEMVAEATRIIEAFDAGGTTVGAKLFGEQHLLELPIAAFSPVKPFEELVLFKLGAIGEAASVSELAERLAAELGEAYTDAFRSKVLYSVDRLGPDGKGYIDQEAEGNSYRTRLSAIGELWVRSHTS